MQLITNRHVLRQWLSRRKALSMFVINNEDDKGNWKEDLIDYIQSYIDGTPNIKVCRGVIKDYVRDIHEVDEDLDYYQ